MRGPTLIRAFAAVGFTVAMTSACLSSGSSGSSGSSSAPSGQASGSTVTVWASMDQPVIDGLKAGLAPLAQAQGITVNWNKVDNINQVIMTKIQANDTPDIALDPAAGRRRGHRQAGQGHALDDVVDLNALKSSMIPGTLEAGTVNGKLYGLLVSANAKSLVWYPKKAWTAAGYTAPRTIDELNALTDKIKADKTATTPWCLGIESTAATGWPATDWFEDLIMRYGGADGYNKWVTHQIKFDSPEVRQAAAEFEKLAFTDGNVLGRPQGDREHQLRHRGQPDVRPEARLHAVQAGLLHHHLLPEERPGQPEQRRRRLLLPACHGGRREADPRRRRHGHAAAQHRRAPARS